MKLIRLILLAGGVWGLCRLPLAKANSVVPANTVTLAPARVDVDFEPGMSGKSIMFTLENSYSSPVTLDTRLTDIDDSAGQLLPVSGVSSEVANIAELSDASISIGPGEKKYVTLSIKNPETLAPGGHYFSVVFTQGGIDGSNVTIHQGISALVFLTKLDGQNRSVHLESFDVPLSRFSAPRAARIAVTNDGNAFATPRASVRVITPDGTVLATGIYNSVSRKLLPGQTLKEGIRLKRIKDVWLPTRVNIELAYRADGLDNIKLSAKSYLYIPSRTIIAILVLMSITVYLLLWRAVKLRRRAISMIRMLVTAEKPRNTPDLVVNLAKSITPTKRKIPNFEVTQQTVFSIDSLEFEAHNSLSEGEASKVSEFTSPVASSQKPDQLKKQTDRDRVKKSSLKSASSATATKKSKKSKSMKSKKI